MFRFVLYNDIVSWYTVFNDGGVFMASASKAKVEANARYDAKAYDKFLIRVPKGKKAEIQMHASSLGESLNGYTVKALEERMEREKKE